MARPSALDAIHDTREDVAEIKGALERHFANAAIHTVPPCDSLRHFRALVLTGCGAIIVLAISSAVAIWCATRETPQVYEFSDGTRLYPVEQIVKNGEKKCPIR